MMGGMDQREIIPLLFRERAEEGMREWRRRERLERGEVGSKLFDRGRLVMRRAGEPPRWDFDARFHPPLTQDSLQDEWAQEFADDPGGPMVRTAQGRAQSFPNVLQDLREIPVPSADITGAVKMVDVRQRFLPALEIEPTSLRC